MKIAQINSQLGGSTGSLMRLLSQAMTKAGIENRMFFTFDTGIQAPAVCYSSHREIKMNAALSRLTGSYGFQSAAATKRLISMLEEYEPDLVQIHNIHGHDVNLEMFYRWLGERNIPVVRTLHDCWEFTGYCPHYQTVKCDKWQTQCHDCPLYKRYSWFFDKSQQNYERKKAASAAISSLNLVTPSYWLKGEVEKSFLKNNPCTVIPNGIDTYIFKPVSSDLKEQLGIAGKKMVLNAAMTVSTAKGKDDLIALSQSLPDDYRLVLVGVPENHQKDFPANVIVRPRTTSKQEMAAYYAAADVFVNPTHEDNFPTVNLEALSCGTPVVTFDAGGAGEMVTDTIGRKVPVGDDETLRNNVIEMAEKKAEISKLCRRHVLEHYTQQIFCDSYLRLYHDIFEN
ncbi:MAG TPA: glycosyl transferase [Erysipelotrichaceae bacterium]|nr:glycosyl transferase [Erysipelotrichaceae bacterium]HCW55748.1 glycosyl transferase [Erysipelotrichaceae bacterium]